MVLPSASAAIGAVRNGELRRSRSANVRAAAAGASPAAASVATWFRVRFCVGVPASGVPANTWAHVRPSTNDTVDNNT